LHLGAWSPGGNSDFIINTQTFHEYQGESSVFAAGRDIDWTMYAVDVTVPRHVTGMGEDIVVEMEVAAADAMQQQLCF
jgi:hypothetical protein